MRQFNVAYDREDLKATVLPVEKDIPKGSTVAGVFDDRDMASAIDRRQLRTDLAEKNKGKDEVLLHFVQTILMRNGVDDFSKVSVTVDKEVTKAGEDARENGTTERQREGENGTATTADPKPKLD